MIKASSQARERYPYMLAYGQVMLGGVSAELFAVAVRQYGERLLQALDEDAPEDAVYYAGGGWVRLYALHPDLRARVLAQVDRNLERGV